MAQYLVTYLDGDTEYVEAEGVEYDSSAQDYTFLKGPNGLHAVALVPVINVRSIIRQAEAATS